MTLDELKRQLIREQYEPKREKCFCGTFPCLTVEAGAIYAYKVRCPKCGREGTAQRSRWLAVEVWNEQINEMIHGVMQG